MGRGVSPPLLFSGRGWTSLVNFLNCWVEFSRETTSACRTSFLGGYNCESNCFNGSRTIPIVCFVLTDFGWFAVFEKRARFPRVAECMGIKLSAVCSHPCRGCRAHSDLPGLIPEGGPLSCRPCWTCLSFTAFLNKRILVSLTFLSGFPGFSLPH